MNLERKYAVHSLSRYWPNNYETILQLPIPEQTPPIKESLPPKTIEVVLPEWAHDIGIEGKLLVPAWTVTSGEQPLWQRTDWLSGVFWYLNGSAEREHEKQYGPIHSYRFRLKGWDPRIWERAWVNRIALFLRRWAARMLKKEENDLFGSLPEPEIICTHDVDAVEKTIAIRCKQSVFHLFNVVRYLSQGKLSKSGGKLAKVERFLLANDDYWCFDQIMALEEQYGIRSYFNVYGGPGGWQRTPKQLLLDPSYNSLQPKLCQLFRHLHQEGWSIGLHQSYNAWSDAECMLKEKHYLEQAVDAPVTICRQHWLRFSWHKTWKTQQEAGLELDTTLGFNDRPGFRNGTALCFHPWDTNTKKPMKLAVLPMVLMDSHLYDYGDVDHEERYQQMNYWLDEIMAVRGTATIIWHQRVMSNDYGWGPGYEYLLSRIKR